MVGFKVQADSIAVSGEVPFWLLLLLLIAVSVPLTVGWIVAARHLRDGSRRLLHELRVWARDWLMRILTERDDRSQ